MMATIPFPFYALQFCPSKWAVKVRSSMHVLPTFGKKKKKKGRKKKKIKVEGVNRNPRQINYQI
jgi:hypothetical protein